MKFSTYATIAVAELGKYLQLKTNTSGKNGKKSKKSNSPWNKKVKMVSLSYSLLWERNLTSTSQQDRTEHCNPANYPEKQHTFIPRLGYWFRSMMTFRDQATSRTLKPLMTVLPPPWAGTQAPVQKQTFIHTPSQPLPGFFFGLQYFTATYELWHITRPWKNSPVTVLYSSCSVFTWE